MNFEKLSNEELVNKIVTDSFTSEAEAIAREILVERGVNVPDKTDGAAEERKLSKWLQLRAFVISCMSGQASLGASYWSLGSLLFVTALLCLIGYELTLTSFAGSFFSTVFFGVILLGSPFHAYCVWKCKKNTSSSFWELLAGVYSGIQLLVWCVLIPFSILGSMLQ